MDNLSASVGTASDELCVDDPVRAQPSEVEKANFATSVWRACDQGFLEHDQAVKAIADFNAGIIT